MLLSTSLFACHFPDDDTPFGVRAINPEIAIPAGVQLPSPELDGKIPTLNQTGFMTPDQNPYIEDFQKFARKSCDPVLDIGAAYGVASLPALRLGANVIANDLDERHLLLLHENAEEECLAEQLILNNKRFPSETEFPE